MSARKKAKYQNTRQIMKEKGDVLKHASDAGDAGDAGYLLKTYNQPCNSLLMSALYETMNSDAGKY